MLFLKRWKASLLILCVMFFSPKGQAYAAHPLVTDDSGTQGKGRYQLELNGEYGHDKEEGIKTETFDLKAIISYGLIDNLDLVLTLPYQKIRIKEEDSRATSEGISDIDLEVKWRFYEKDGLSFALKPGLTLPTGDEGKGLGTGKVTLSIFFITTYEHSPWAVHLNGGYIRNENKTNERKDIWHLSLAGTCEVIEDLKLVSNIGIERNTDRESKTAPAFILAGLIYSLSKDLDIDIGVKAGLNEAETDYSILAGLTRRF
ncbi:MAG: transporter [Thermodesulfovibrionales bacterium]